MTTHIFLSPHLDDAVFSCGGLMARQARRHETVMVVTICAGDPPPEPLSDFAQQVQLRWAAGSAPLAARREEDIAACELLGASVVHLDFEDAIYRTNREAEPLYASEADIFGPLRASESALVRDVAEALAMVCARGEKLYCPLGIGGHVDHRLARRAVEQLGRRLFYYFDFPYAARGGKVPLNLPIPSGVEWVLPLLEEELELWRLAATAYASQISTFWPDADTLENELHRYHNGRRGLILVAPG